MLIRSFAAISTLCASLLFAEEKVEIVAKHVEHENNVTVATGEAVAVGDGYFMRADKIVYHKENSMVEGYGDIFVLKDSSFYTVSDYVKIYLDEKKGYFDKFFLEGAADGVWVSSKDAKANNKIYTVDSAVSSSCNPSNPDWYLKYSTGEFDSESKVMTLKNTTLYLKDVPLLYTPYFSFSTDKTRRSGLLKPDIGIKGNEGFIYIQPIYLVTDPEASWDVELQPQVRTKRGQGLNGILRFMDSKYSKGYLKSGYFKDTESFREQYNLKYGSHYGTTFFYDREKLFSSKFPKDGTEDGLYINLNYLNDIDYVNLQARDNLRDNNVDRITTSKINYYFEKNNNYFGAYMKYYIDTSKTSNDDTVQEYPKLQYHRNTESLFFDNLTYSFDMTSKRYDRRSGLNALQNQAFLPVSYTTHFFDDFVGLSFMEHLYANKVGFTNKQGLEMQDYAFYSNTHKAKLFTNLQKSYDSFIHSLDIELLYTKPGAKKESNYPTQKDELITLVTSSSESENSTIKLAQFFYDSKGNLALSHRLNQAIYHDASRVDYKYGDLENEIIYKINKNISISTDIFYSHKDSLISAATSSISYNDGDLITSLSHVYKDQSTLLGKDRGSYFALNASKRLDYKYSLFGSYEYDEYARETRAWSLGLNMLKKCMSYSLSVKHEATPILTSTESSSIKNYIVYFSINLIPLGGLNQAYSISSRK
ncbi:MAG: LPS-assembly protein LptD [Campylobacterales bacterium]